MTPTPSQRCTQEDDKEGSHIGHHIQSKRASQLHFQTNIAGAGTPTSTSNVPNWCGRTNKQIG
eukprot:1749969-Pyramimonas_sp.AAC.1